MESIHEFDSKEKYILKAREISPCQNLWKLFYFITFLFCGGSEGEVIEYKFVFGTKLC
jgi:hypothetical protein